jgi:hypothetical protein
VDPFVQGGPPRFTNSIFPIEMLHYIENIIGMFGLKAAKVEIG